MTAVALEFRSALAQHYRSVAGQAWKLAFCQVFCKKLQNSSHRTGSSENEERARYTQIEVKCPRGQFNHNFQICMPTLALSLETKEEDQRENIKQSE